MAKRSITDEEISLIKAMLGRGMKNKDIQFFFNRPERAVNSGRITAIRSGAYGPAQHLPSASDALLDAFLMNHQPAGIPATPPASPLPPISADPLDETTIRALFAQGVDGLWRLAGGETDSHECKASFGMRHPQPWLRAVAALANNSGGYIFFGVNDKNNGGDDHVVIGLTSEEFRNVDQATLSGRIKGVFDPTPRFRTARILIGGRTVGVLHVERHHSRPVIATKQDGDKIREGDIFFRYPGQSTRIKYSDLRAMLDARDKEARIQILPMVERLLQIGPERSFVADLEQGKISDGRASIQIDEALLEKLSFIKQGEFVETAGAPALRLVGDVRAASGSTPGTTEHSLVTRKAMLDAFLAQTVPQNPELYVRFPVEVGQGEWMPLHYFAGLSGLSRAQLIDFIESTNGTPSRKRTYIDRVQVDAAYRRTSGKPGLMLESILAGTLPAVTTVREASHAGVAICALPPGCDFDPDSMLAFLRQCLTLTAGTPATSFVRRAICRVDELLYAEKQAGVAAKSMA